MQSLTQGSMQIEADPLKVLIKLRENLKAHIKNYDAAKQGYLEDVRVALAAQAEKWSKKEPMDELPDLYVTLEAPCEYTSEYNTAITMLEFHQGDSITLDATQVRHFLMDEWSWKASFSETVANYSKIGARR